MNKKVLLIEDEPNIIEAVSFILMRDGWEDYRLLTALRRQGKDQLVDELLAAFRRNEPPAALRLKALDGGGYPSGR